MPLSFGCLITYSLMPLGHTRQPSEVSVFQARFLTRTNNGMFPLRFCNKQPLHHTVRQIQSQGNAFSNACSMVAIEQAFAEALPCDCTFAPVSYMYEDWNKVPFDWAFVTMNDCTHTRLLHSQVLVHKQHQRADVCQRFIDCL